MSDKPYTCTYCKKPTAQAPHHLPIYEGEPDAPVEPPRYMPSCCLDCSQLDPVVWDSKPLNEATPEELAVILPMPPAPDTDEMPLAATADIEAVCPSCGANVAVSQNPPAVLHSMPMCKDFTSRDALGYLRWLNDRLESSSRSDA